MAIQSASYQANEQVGPDRYRVRIRIVTNDSRGTFEQWFDATGDTAIEIRDAVSRQLAAMVAVDNQKNVLDGIAVGFNVPLTAPAAPAPTAKAIWREKVSRYKTLAGPAYSGTAATALSALLADINATYQSGFVDA
jgi:hypothetical protein